MGIFRSHRKQHNFSILDNSGAEDKNLSLRGKGMLWYLLTKPDGWEVRNEHLMSALNIGKDQLASTVRDLEDAGYLIRIKRRTNSGKFDWVVEVFETPQDCEKWKELNQELIASALGGSTNLRVPKRKRIRDQFSTTTGIPASGCPTAGDPGAIVTTDGEITDLGITDSINQAVNRAYKAFPKTPREKNNLPISSGKNTNEEKKKPHSDLTRQQVGNSDSKQTSEYAPGVNSQDSRQERYSANSLKKEKETKIAFRLDSHGVIQLPATKKYKFPAILAMRSMQFLLAQQLDCSFAVDSGGKIWIDDPKMGNWMTEAEAFGGGSEGEQGHLPLKKMVAILRDETAAVQLDTEWYNEAIKGYFHYWHEQCQKLGKDAVAVIKQKSVGLWLQQYDPDFDIEFEDFDAVA